VDTTVQTKAIRFPTDARLYHRMRERLVTVARTEGLEIKQSYQYVGKRLLMQSSRYAHARQMKRARACTRQLKTQLVRVLREIDRQTTEPSRKLSRLLETARRIHAQQRHDKNKVYSVHEPEVECIAKPGPHGQVFVCGVVRAKPVSRMSLATKSALRSAAGVGGSLAQRASREIPMMATRWPNR
jgi:IS5 family transposase